MREKKDLALAFGKNLVRIRRLADVSQEELSLRAGLHRTEISQLERGLRLPRFDTILKLAAVLEEEPGVFFEGVRWRPGNLRRGSFQLDPEAGTPGAEGGGR
jgi:transcriptional regulator with XRE-family HTH domain